MLRHLKSIINMFKEKLTDLHAMASPNLTPEKVSKFATIQMFAFVWSLPNHMGFRRLYLLTCGNNRTKCFPLIPRKSWLRWCVLNFEEWEPDFDKIDHKKVFAYIESIEGIQGVRHFYTTSAGMEYWRLEVLEEDLYTLFNIMAPPLSKGYEIHTYNLFPLPTCVQRTHLQKYSTKIQALYMEAKHIYTFSMIKRGGSVRPMQDSLDQPTQHGDERFCRHKKRKLRTRFSFQKG